MGGMQVGRGVGKWGGGVFSQWGRWAKTPVQTFSWRFLKTLTEGAVTREAGSLFQCFTCLTENADPLLRRRRAHWSTLKGCPLRPRRAGGRKKVRINIQIVLFGAFRIHGCGTGCRVSKLTTCP